ncbi:MAG: ABC transporter ATP-binding protein, partial [Agathobacter sp.]|nr:ABC transporter ATP-binding protein [Agathobacter sp.]
MERRHKMAENKKRRSGIAVMAGLIGMIRPLLGYMIIAIIMGCIGNLMATFITILGGYGFLSVFGVMEGVNLTLIFVLLVAFAVLRGVLRYAEQACNHFIAFKLLARIRHKVFAALRKLAPAKLDGSEKGNLISIITSDIELLEVFYAHTISPIAIAIITSVFMVCFLGNLHVAYGVLGFVFYVIVGVVIPLVNGKMGGAKGQQYRNSFGELNTCVLDNLYGLEEIIEYAQQDVRQQNLNERTQELGNITEKLK